LTKTGASPPGTIKPPILGMFTSPCRAVFVAGHDPLIGFRFYCPTLWPPL
jgi:hypothetical protein